MARIDGDDDELTGADAALVKGMLARGDHQHHVAAWFGVDSRAVSHISNGKSFTEIKAAAPTKLPPPGPHRPDPAFVHLYQDMTRVNELWEARRLKDAKALLEAVLKSPTLPLTKTEVEQAADDLLRDEYGIMSV